MRKLLLVCLLIPVIGFGQSKNVINFFRVFAKPDKGAELEKKLAEHAQKYHSGNWKWRVFEIQTGPDATGFQVIEGPLSWEDFDARGDLGPEHTAHWNNNIAPLTTGVGTQAYATFLEELSTVQIKDYSDKIIINHMYPKPGMINKLKDMIANLRKAWQAGNESVAVYESNFSGEPQISTSTRLKAGLKELAPGFRKPIQERYDSANAPSTWNNFLKDYADCVERRWSEMLLYRPELSSK